MFLRGMQCGFCRQLAMRDKVVKRTQRILDFLQPLREAPKFVVGLVRIKAVKKLDGVADLLDFDPQLVSLAEPTDRSAGGPLFGPCARVAA